MLKYKNNYWYLYHGALLPSVEPSIPIELTDKEKNELLKISGAYFLRYTSDWDINEESEFWYIIKDKKEDIKDYKSNNRTQIRKGLKGCKVVKVSKEEIAKNAYKVYKEAFLSYKIDGILLSEDIFNQNIMNSVKHDFWAVYENLHGNKGEMIAYSQNIVHDNSISYSTVKFNPHYLKLYPSYALFFEMNKYYLNEKNFLYVSDGARSIAHDTNIQKYLVDKFHFRKAYCKLNIVYRWDIRIIVKIMYPFKGIINKVDNKFFIKLSILLKQEKIQRSFN